MDSFLVENILRPSVLGPGHDVEHFFHAGRNPGPMMGLDLRHGYDEISGLPSAIRLSAVGITQLIVP